MGQYSEALQGTLRSPSGEETNLGLFLAHCGKLLAATTWLCFLASLLLSPALFYRIGEISLNCVLNKQLELSQGPFPGKLNQS